MWFTYTLSFIFVLFIPCQFSLAQPPPTPHPAFPVPSGPHIYFQLLHQGNQKHSLSWGLSPFKLLCSHRRAGICFVKGCSETKGDKSSAKLCPAYYVPFIGQSLLDLWPCVHTVSLLADGLFCCDHMWMMGERLWLFIAWINYSSYTITLPNLQANCSPSTVSILS